MAANLQYGCERAYDLQCKLYEELRNTEPELVTVQYARYITSNINNDDVCLMYYDLDEYMVYTTLYISAKMSDLKNPFIALNHIGVKIEIINSSYDTIYQRENANASHVIDLLREYKYIREIPLPLTVERVSDEKIVNDEECPVCYELHSSVRVLRHCSHQFCNMCIQTWIKDHTTCPLCRANLN